MLTNIFKRMLDRARRKVPHGKTSASVYREVEPVIGEKTRRTLESLISSLSKTSAEYGALKTKLDKIDQKVDKLYQEFDEQHTSFQRRATSSLFLVQIGAFGMLRLPESVPPKVQKKTYQTLKSLLKVPSDELEPVLNRNKFRAHEHWALYWILAHAATTAATITRLRNEDGGSTEFSFAIRSSVSMLKEIGLMDSASGIFLEPIYLNTKRGAVESEVGADLLLIFVGKGLIGDVGLRMVWIQAKRPDTMTFSLNYWRQTQSQEGGLRQFNRLKGLHRPEQGSFSVYAQYVSTLKSTFAIGIERIPQRNSDVSDECVVDMAANGGMRLQEMLTQLVTTPVSVPSAGGGGGGLGIFPSVKAADAFLRLITRREFEVLALASINDLEAQTLIQEIKRDYAPSEDEDDGQAPAAPDRMSDADQPDDTERPLGPRP